MNLVLPWLLKRSIPFFLLLCALPLPALADWQFTVDVPGTKAKAYLWIPPHSPYLRGLIIGQQVILEDKVLQDPVIRDAAAKENLGIILICPGVLGYFENKGDDLRLQQILDSLAAESGYHEISQAPLLTIGHSGMGIFAWMVAYWNPARTLGVIGLHCMSSQPPAWNSKATVEGVPILGISGQYESWGNPHMPLDTHWRWLRAGLLFFRSYYENALMSEVVDPGGTHFSFNSPLARYVALFIHKVAQYRLPPDSGKIPEGPVTLRNIPAESGWLTDLNLMTPSQHPPAPYSSYTGDRSLAFWQFDEEMAQANETYRSEAKGKKDQRLTFTQDGKPLPASWLEELKFEPMQDGMTFQVSADFLSRTPEGVAGSGQPLGHAGGPIQFSLIGGWRGGGEQLGPNLFRIHPGHLGPSDNIMFLAYHPGDGTYAWAEQGCQVKYPSTNLQGQKQTIHFPPLPDVPSQTKKIELKATADSGLPVDYYLIRGPAELQGNDLIITPIPSRVHQPIKITVVAYQWGRSIPPLVQTAPPVEQTFQILP